MTKVVACFKSGLVKDPFSKESNSLSNIATDVVLPIAERLVTSVAKRQEQINSFIEQCLNSNNVSFWNAIPSPKNKTFCSTICGEMAAKYFEVLTAHFQQGCHRLDVVFDQY